jgi:hypothetical protein
VGLPERGSSRVGRARPGSMQRLITEAHGIPVAPGHVSEFANILTGRRGERFDAWITAVDAPAFLICALLVTGSSATTTPSSPDSPCRTAPERSKAT